MTLTVQQNKRAKQDQILTHPARQVVIDAEDCRYEGHAAVGASDDG